MAASICGIDCTKCGLSSTCNGCMETNAGHLAQSAWLRYVWKKERKNYVSPKEI